MSKLATPGWNLFLTESPQETYSPMASAHWTSRAALECCSRGCPSRDVDGKQECHSYSAGNDEMPFANLADSISFHGYHC